MEDAAASPAISAEARTDLATLVAISLLVYAFGDVLHELVAHGGVCVALGGRAVDFDTVHMDCDSLSAGAMRAVSAAGTILNLVVGFVALAIAERRKGRGLADYALWLLAIHEVFIGAGYLLASPLGHFGDWDAFVRGLPFEWGWRIGLTLIGVAMYRLAGVRAGRMLQRFLPAEPELRKARARVLAWTPYVSGGLLLLLGGLLNRVGWQLIFISAIAAGFMGPIGFIFLPLEIKPATGEVRDWPRWRQGAWVSAVSLAVVIAFAWIARGVALV